MILFTKDINTNKLRMAYNNDIIRFYSNATSPAEYAEVALRDLGGTSDLFRVRLYPDPQGKFFLNLRPYITSLINSREFEDTLETDIESGDPASFVYEFTESTYFNRSLIIKVANAEDSEPSRIYNLTWLAGVEQIGNPLSYKKTDIVVLSPLQKLSNNQHYFKYWQGYPFDIAFYAAQKDFALRNNTNGFSQNLRIKGYISRLFLSDGRTDETLEGLLPLVEGRNSLSLQFPNQQKCITLDKEPYKCGVYVKWLNKYGGYSYWLFENTYSVDRSTKYLGELERDNTNLEDTKTRTVQIGKESQDTLKVVAELLTEEERTIVEGIIDSPKIYLFTGQPYSRSGARDWMEVTLKTSSIRTKNPRQPLTNFAFDLELPMRYTQVL